MKQVAFSLAVSTLLLLFLLSPTQFARGAAPSVTEAPLASETAHASRGYSTTTFSGSRTVSPSLLISVTDALNQQRLEHSATTLNDGRVLVAGGARATCEGGCEIHENLASAELYDPAQAQFVPTGDLQRARSYHEATLLDDGRVLITGGAWCVPTDKMTPCYYLGSTFHPTSSAELYDPVSGTFQLADEMTVPRLHHTATRLEDGRVLVAGGVRAYDIFTRSAELYDPVTELFIPAGNMHFARSEHSATLLEDGRVLIAGGSSATSTAELYDPSTGTFTLADSMNFAGPNVATRLLDGDVLVISRYGPSEIYRVATGTFEPGPTFNLYDPIYQAFTLSNGLVVVLADGRQQLYDPATDAIVSYREDNYPDYIASTSAALLHDDSILMPGGLHYPCDDFRYCTIGYSSTLSRLVSVAPGNSFTGYLTMPNGWVTSAVTVVVSGTTTAAPLEAGELNTRTIPTGGWFGLTNGEPVTRTVALPSGRNRWLSLHLLDAEGQIAAQIVTGTVDVDTQLPYSSLFAPSQTKPGFTISWQGGDGPSGLAAFDVQVREGENGEWTDLFTYTQVTSTTFTGTSGTTYFFRVRAHDVAGNIEAWPDPYIPSILVDATAPTGTLSINQQAHASTTRAVTLAPYGTDTVGRVTEMRLSSDGQNWGDWRPYSPQSTLDYTLPSGDGIKTVYVQFRDQAGNISPPISDTIRLDRAAGTDRTITINNGAASTQSTLVTLTIGAPGGTTHMQLSNDGGFGGATWLRFNTRPQWQITSEGTVYVRTRDAAGNISVPYSDNIRYEPPVEEPTRPRLYLPLLLRR